MENNTVCDNEELESGLDFEVGPEDWASIRELFDKIFDSTKKG